MSYRIIRRGPTLNKTGLSKSYLYEKVRNGSFPAPVKLGRKAVGWVESEVDDWISQQMEKRSQLRQKASQLAISNRQLTGDFK